VGQTGGLSCDTLKDVIDEAVHDGHSFAGHSSIGMNLLQDFVDVNGVRFPPPPLPLLVPGTGGLSLAGSLLGSFGGNFGWHSVCLEQLNGEEPQLTSPLYAELYANE